ncbi:hypothetical protein ACOMHN_065578 [Nucella lapillus]
MATYLVRAFVRLQRLRCGMQVKNVRDENYNFCYGERGQRSTERSSILFIHGFTSSKDLWTIAFKNLPKEYHLIALDMPGHGATTTPPDSQPQSPEYLTSTIKQFAERVGLTDRPFHIVGNSLGGCHAGVFASLYPHLVDRVTMIAPIVECPVDTAYTLEVKKVLDMRRKGVELDLCSLLPETPHDLQLTLNNLDYHQVKVNPLMLKGFFELRQSKYPYFKKVYREFVTEENLSLLEDNCHRITMPSQVIWGANDQIVHPSGAQMLEKKLPDCRDMTVLERCGHRVHVDQPHAICSAISRFRGDVIPEN